MTTVLGRTVAIPCVALLIGCRTAAPAPSEVRSDPAPAAPTCEQRLDALLPDLQKRGYAPQEKKYPYGARYPECGAEADTVAVWFVERTETPWILESTGNPVLDAVCKRGGRLAVTSLFRVAPSDRQRLEACILEQLGSGVRLGMEKEVADFYDRHREFLRLAPVDGKLVPYLDGTVLLDRTMPIEFAVAPRCEVFNGKHDVGLEVGFDVVLDDSDRRALAAPPKRGVELAQPRFAPRHDPVEVDEAWNACRGRKDERLCMDRAQRPRSCVRVTYRVREKRVGCHEHVESSPDAIRFVEDYCAQGEPR